MSSGRFLTIEQIRKKYEDIGQMTLHGTPPGDWFARWMDDVGMLLGLLDAENRVRVTAEIERDAVKAQLSGKG